MGPPAGDGASYVETHRFTTPGPLPAIAVRTPAQ